MKRFALGRYSRQHGTVLMLLIGASLLLLSGCRSFVSELQQKPEATAENATTAPVDFSDLPTRAPVASTAAADRAATAAAVSGAEVGRPAPDFTLPTLDGQEVSLSDYEGRPVLINFWASWCPPCRLEMPHLIEAYEANQDEGFMVLAVDLTFQDSLSDVEAFVEEFGVTFPVLLDQDGSVTNRLYRLLGLPMSVFVNREGIVTHVQIGAMSGDQVETLVTEIVQE